MNKMPKHFHLLIGIVLITLIASACNYPGSNGNSTEAAPTDEQSHGITTEPGPDARPTTETTPTADSGGGDGGPPTPDMSDVDPMGGYSPIDRLSPSDRPLTLTYLWMESASSGWAIGSVDGPGAHVFRTDTGVDSWDDVSPPAPATIPDLGHPAAASGAFLDDSTAWIIYYPDVSIYEAGGLANAFVWYTTDGGDTWSHSAPMRTEMIGSSNIPPDIIFTDENHGWIMMQIGGIGMHTSPVYLFRTTDGGATWEKLEDPYEGIYLQGCTKTGMAFHGSNYGMVTISDCPVDGFRIHWTSDGGETWNEQRPPAPASMPDLFSYTFCNAYSPSFLDDGTAVFGVECNIYEEDRIAYFIYRSSDNGATWTAEEYPGGDVLFLNTNTGWGLGEDIQRTLDGGSTWSLLNTVIWNGQFVFVDADTGWAIARNADEIATVSTTTGGASWSIVESYVTE